MNPRKERRVFALVTCTSAQSLEHIRRTFESIAQQNRPLDHVLVSYEQSLSHEQRAYIDSLVENGAVSQAHPHTSEASFAAIIDSLCEQIPQLDRNAKSSNGRDHVSSKEGEEATTPPEQLASEVTESSNSPKDFTLINPAFGSRSAVVTKDDSDPSRAADPSASFPEEPIPYRGPRGRRLATTNIDQVERSNNRAANAIAHVPERLRSSELDSATGRRRLGKETAGDLLWILNGDSVPSIDALAQQITALDSSPAFALVGTKHLALEDLDRAPARLVDLGLSLTHSHRLLSSVEAGEIDQGQADWRSDVLAVTAPGMLIKKDRFEQLDGFDSALVHPFAEIDLSMRLWRAGERVQVVPSASTRVPLRSHTTELSSESRASQILSLVKYRSFGFALLTAIAIPFVGAIFALTHLFNERPGLAWTEIKASLSALLQAPSALLHRRGESDRLRVPRRRLAPLFMPRAVAAREWFDRWWTARFTDDERTRRIRRTTWGIAGTSHGLDDADYGRHTVWTLVVTLFSVVVGLMSIRSLLKPGTLSGPGFVPLTREAADIRDAVFSGWIPEGLGQGGPADAFVRLVSIFGSLAGALPVIALCGGVILSGVCAWFAAGTITRSIAVRWAATLMWMSAAPLMYSIAEGRWPLVIVHILLPLAAERFAHAVGLPHKVSQASISAAAASGIVLAVISTIQPMLAVLFLVGLCVVARWVPGRRGRLLWVAAPIIGLHLPNLGAYVLRPASLFATAGVPLDFEAPGRLWPLVFTPTSSHPIAAVFSINSDLGASLVAGTPLIIALIGTLGAALLRNAAGIVGRIALAATGICSLLAFAGTHIVVGFNGTTGFTAQPGALLSCAAAAAIIGFICTADAVARRSHKKQAAFSRLIAAATGTVTLAVSFALVALWAFLGPQALHVTRSGTPEIPAVAADQGTSSNRSRTLVLNQSADGAVDARIISEGALSIDQSSGSSRIRVANALSAAKSEDPADKRLAQVIVSNVSAQSTSATPTSLADFGIGYVVVSGDMAAQAALIDQLSVSPRFEEVTVSEAGGLWRVIEPASRAVIIDPNGSQIQLASERTRVVDSVSASGHTRTIRLAERFNSSWSARIGSKELKPIKVDGWAQGFEIPAGVHGTLEIEPESHINTVLVLVGFAMLALTVLASLPLRRRQGGAE